MSTSAHTFASSKHFDEFTYKLSQSMKSMKVSTLRESIAKAEGYSHVDAFRKKLDEQKPRPIIQKTLSDYRFRSLPDIFVESNKIVFVGLPVLGTWDPSETSYDLTGHSDLLTPIYDDESLDYESFFHSEDSDIMIQGYMPVPDKTPVDDVEYIKAFRNFYLGQSSDWEGREFANEAFYWIHDDAWMLQLSNLEILADHISEKNTSEQTIEKLKEIAMFYMQGTSKARSILGFPLTEIPFGKARLLSNEEASLRYSAILFTVFDYLKYIGLKSLDTSLENYTASREHVKKTLRSHFYHTIPYIILPAVFAGIPIHSTNETVSVAARQIEAISSALLYAITTHPEIWSMGNTPIHEALNDYYLVESDSDGRKLEKVIEKSGAAQHILKGVPGLFDKSDYAISIINNYVLTALTQVEHLQTLHPVYHTFKRNPFALYGSPEGGAPAEISPTISYYAKQLKSVLDLSVATGKALRPIGL